MANTHTPKQLARELRRHGIHVSAAYVSKLREKAAEGKPLASALLASYYSLTD